MMNLSLLSKGADVITLQRTLNAHGANLVEDGAFGHATLDAVKAFQARSGLTPDGIVGPKTWAALAVSPKAPTPTYQPPSPSVAVQAPWLTYARALDGEKEIPGARSNPLILQWIKEISAIYPDIGPNINWYSNDDTPWCGLFTGICVTRAGQKPPKALLGARNWMDAWEDGVRLKGPALGAIAVKSRAGGGHVGFYEGEDQTYYFINGGNQSNMANVSRIRKDAGWLGFMWPKHYAMPQIKPVYTTFANAKEGSEA